MDQLTKVGPDEWGSEKVTRTYWNAIIFGETRRQMEATELMRTLTAQQRAKLQGYADEHLALVEMQINLCSVLGLELSNFPNVRSSGDLSESQRNGLLACPPEFVAIPDGQGGVYLVPWETVAAIKLEGEMPLLNGLEFFQIRKRDIEAKQKAMLRRIFTMEKSEAALAAPSPATQLI